MSKVKVTNPIIHIPAVKEFRISSSELWKRIKALPAEWKDIDLEDGFYFYTDWESWGKILEYLKPTIPKYLTDRFDCDNFSRWFNSEVSRIFQINTCGIVEGYMGTARHKWNMIFDGEFYQMESQTGVIFDFPNYIYKPDEILVG